MSTGGKIQLRVLTPARQMFDGAVQSVVLPTFDGLWGILPGHAPFIAILGTGRMIARDLAGNAKAMAVRGGFFQVAHDELIVLTSQGATREDIAPEALREEREAIESRAVKGGAERQQRDEQLLWVKAREDALRPPPENY